MLASAHSGRSIIMNCSNTDNNPRFRDHLRVSKRRRDESGDQKPSQNVRGGIAQIGNSVFRDQEPLKGDTRETENPK